MTFLPIISVAQLRRFGEHKSSKGRCTLRSAEHWIRLPERDETEGRTPAERLYFDTYRLFSNYVHAKYPECMDLYGGRPGQFHLHGMNGTPKEGENLEILQTFTATLMNCFVRMIQGLNLQRFVEADAVIGTWSKKIFEK